MRKAVVVREDADRRAVEVVELAGIDRPPEGRADEDREHDAQGNEEKKDVHG